MQEKNLDGLFDVAYLDGAHTLYHDGTACCILKELMRKKGLLVLDDLKWSYASSPTMSKNPELHRYMTDEQIKDCQMKRVENLFMAHDARYRRVSKEDDARAVYQRVW